MIKIGPKISRITSLFCLHQHFSMMTSLIFTQNIGNYSFLCIYWAVYCIRIHCHSLGSYWILSNYQKIWRHYHSFSADVSIFPQWLFKFLTKNIFPLIFELLIPWTWLTPHFLAFWEIYILVIHWWPISIPKHQMGLNDATWLIFS